MDIEAMGGLLKQMPRSGYLFLIGSLAICGLPPFNGFVSEFFIYNGLFNGLLSNQFLLILFILFAILGLVMIGGLALVCFTKAFGIVFLGTQRGKGSEAPIKESQLRIVPLYFVALAIVLIGVFPVLLSPMLQKIILLYQPVQNLETILRLNGLLASLTSVGWYSLGFIALTAFFYIVRRMVQSHRIITTDNTWGCAYTGDASKMQYTASSFIRTYRKLAEPILQIKRDKKEAIGLYPEHISQVTHPHDKLETWLIDKPMYLTKRLLNRFAFLQNGNVRAYILYGFIFISSAIVLPIVIDKIILIIKFFNQL